MLSLNYDFTSSCFLPSGNFVNWITSRKASLTASALFSFAEYLEHKSLECFLKFHIMTTGVALFVDGNQASERSPKEQAKMTRVGLNFGVATLIKGQNFFF